MNLEIKESLQKNRIRDMIQNNAVANNIIIKGKDPEKFVTGSQAMAELLVHSCCEKLSKEYPSNIWHVEISSDMSVVRVRCLNVDGQYGYTLHTTDVQNDPELKCIKRAGGEILERAFISRDKTDHLQIADQFDLQGITNRRLADKDTSIKRLINGR
jgi:hypothetical protein